MEEYKNQQIVLFDGICNLCEGVVQFLLIHNKSQNLSFASLQSKSGQKILKHLGLSQDNFNSFIFLENGVLYQKSEGALNLIPYLSGIWKIFLILKIFPKSFNDFFYDLIAKNRIQIFGSKTQCWLPTKALKSRFLD